MSDDIKAFRKYKKAKAILEDLEAVSKIIALTIKALTFYKKYAIVGQILGYLQDAKITLDSQKKKIVVIVNNKGKE